VIEALEQIEKEQRHYLEILKKAAADVTHGKFETAGSQMKNGTTDAHRFTTD